MRLSNVKHLNCEWVYFYDPIPGLVADQRVTTVPPTSHVIHHSVAIACGCSLQTKLTQRKKSIEILIILQLYFREDFNHQRGS